METGKLKTIVAVTLLASVTLLVFSLFTSAADQEPNKAGQKPNPEIEELRAGKNFIPTKVYSAEEDQRILKLFEGLRVADVTDGMDKAGLRNIGVMLPDIHPAWKDTVHYEHRFVGIALTVRYVPTNKPPVPIMETKAFDSWVGNWYDKLSSEPFVPLIRKGTALVLDDAPNADVGSIGSNNIMSWKSAGCVGVVTDATARDTDEIATEKVPLYFRKVGRGIRPGRNEIESVNRPVVCGGVLVEPGDIVVADGDGVIVVPRAYAGEVAEYARATIEKDKSSRLDLYKKLGLPLDDSVK
jgi:4-hydroxy-4-methyl-2-oxoglutarate aldolase